MKLCHRNKKATKMSIMASLNVGLIFLDPFRENRACFLVHTSQHYEGKSLQSSPEDLII